MDQQAFFHCPTRISAEWFVDSVPSFRANTSGLTLGLALGDESPAKAFKKLLLRYTRRKLTFQGDAMRAMAGIIRRFSQLPELQGGFFQGIPRSSFDSSLLFTCTSRSLRRRHGFPSYSWTGWIGPLEYIFQNPGLPQLKDWLSQYTWITWFSRQPSSSRAPTLVWDHSALDDSLFALLRYEGYLRSRQRPSLDESGLSYPAEEAQIMPRELPAAINVREDLPYPLLQFWTFAVFYPMNLRRAKSGMTDIVDREGQRCGGLFLDGFHDLDFVYTGPKGKVFEFILLSRYEDEDVDLATFDINGVFATAKASSPHDPWDPTIELGYYVMCLEWSCRTTRDRHYLEFGGDITELRPGANLEGDYPSLIALCSA